MINIIPKKVLINLIGNIGVDQLVEIPQNQLVGILAENKDFGGSNSSGKSNFTYAMPINLFGASVVGVTNDEIKNDKIKGTPRIIGYYDINDKELIVNRIIGGVLSATFDGTALEGDNKAVQKKIEEIIGLNQEQFKQLTYKDQEEPESFLDMTDSEKKDFLSSFFDTSFVDKMKDKTDSELKDLNKDISNYEITKDVLSKDLTELEVKLKEKISEKDSKVDIVNTSIKSNSDLIKTVEIQREALISQVPETDPDYLSRLVTTTPIIDQLNTEIEAKKVLISVEKAEIDLQKLKLSQIPEPVELIHTLNQCNLFMETIKTAEKDISNLKVKIQINSNEATRLIESILGPIKDCPTCKRPMDTQHLDEEVAKINDKSIALAGENEILQNQVAEKESTLASKDELLGLIAQTKNDISSYKEKYSSVINHEVLVRTNKCKEIELSVREAELCKSQHQSDLDNALSTIKQKHKQEISVIESQIKSLNSENNGLVLTIKSLEDSLVQYKQSIDSKKSSLDLLIKNNESKVKRISVLNHISFITSKNGFIGHIFDSILDQLNSEIRANLSMIPITRDLTLEFKPEKTIKSTGATNKDITFDIFDGDKKITFNRISGGQKLCVKLAVDEALDTVISQVLGIKVGFKVLDERLHFVDNNSKEAVMDFLRVKSESKTYIIVDHSSELNSSFESIIKVTRENGVATIVNY